jgi:glycosyltransferase involved in cell wall biosynthesis
MTTAFYDYFRCCPHLARFDVAPDIPHQPGFFRLGDDLICYGRSKGVRVTKDFCDVLQDALPSVSVDRGRIRFPFDPDEIADYLRYERYPADACSDSFRLGASPMVRDLYYVFRPLMPVPVRSVLQRIHLREQLNNPFPNWPVDRTVDRLFELMMELALRSNGNDPIPFIWFWPEGKRAAFVLTHDVESSVGVAFCPRLMDLDEEFGFRSSFQIVPEKRYEVTHAFLQEIKSRGFEVNVHDLNHDGNLFRERQEFRRRAAKINQYAAQFGTTGFRSGALYRRLDWYDALNVAYDMSVPNAAHLDPQNGGCCTIMPYFVGSILELPVTGTQDYSLFHILNQYSINLWKQQSDLVIRGNGLLNLITHPDYLVAQEARRVYRQLLDYLAETCKLENVWSTLPAEIDRWWRLRHKMRMVLAGNSWLIQGEGSERARIAYARLVNGKLEYTIATPAPPPELPPVYPINAATSSTPCELVLEETNSVPDFAELFSSAANETQTAVHTATAARNWEGQHPDSQLLPPNSHVAPHIARTPMPVAENEPVPSRASDSGTTNRKCPRRLRVCVVAYTFYESDNRVMRYAETLVQEGHEVEVFALQSGGNPRNEEICGVQVHRLQSRIVNEKGQLSYAWRICLFLIRAFYHVSKNDLKKKYHLVHVHSVPDFLVFTALVPRLRGTPVILDIHDILPEFYAGKFGAGNRSWSFRFLTLVEKLSANFASHVIIANHIWKERLISRSVTPSHCTVVLNSPDRSIFHPSAKAPVTNGRFLLLYPGTLNWHQGLDIAIRAFAKISGDVPDADFHIYGEGPSRPLLADLIRTLRLEGRVMLHESRRLREIAGIMEKADLGIVPKRKDNFGNEAFSTKIFEFMAMRVPVIVSDTRIDRYYFDDSLVRFFKGGDADDLARCMLDLIQHPEKRRALVDRASKFIDKNDWSVKKEEYLNLVAHLTNPEPLNSIR